MFLLVRSQHIKAKLYILENVHHCYHRLSNPLLPYKRTISTRSDS